MHNHKHGNDPSMNQMIFKIGLSMETISVYLLFCGLSDSGKAITTGELAAIWNGTETALDNGLNDLEEKHIITRIISDGEEKNIYRLTDVRQWKIK